MSSIALINDKPVSISSGEYTFDALVNSGSVDFFISINEGVRWSQITDTSGTPVSITSSTLANLDFLPSCLIKAQFTDAEVDIKKTQRDL